MGSAHAASYGLLGDRVRVKTLLSLGSERSRKLAASLGAHLVRDLDEALSDPEVDAVDICLPTYLHREAAEKAFAVGLHVFLEKPIGLSPEDADAILAAANRSRRVLMVGLVLRFWPEYAALHRLVATGELGRPLAVSTHRLSPPADWNQWMDDDSLSGGVAVDVLVHDLDQMNWLLGQPRTVFARRPSPGHVMAILEYQAGTCGLAEASLAMPGSYPFSAGPTEEGGNIGNPQSERGLRLYPSGGKPHTVPVGTADPWGREIAYFVDCVEQGRMPEQGSGEQARDALLVSLAVNRSLASGRVEAI